MSVAAAAGISEHSDSSVETARVALRSADGDMKIRADEASDLEREFAKADLGDARRTKRLMRLVNACALAPDKSFPEIAGSRGQLEAFYRFFGNDEVDYREMLAPHAEETALRAATARKVLSLHDSSQLDFDAEACRQGLGRLGAASQGFLVHESLCVTADGSRRALGTLALKPWIRAPKVGKTRRKTGAEFEATAESNRWAEQVEVVESVIAGRAEVIHVMDAEADAYFLLAALTAKDRRFVVRLTKDRAVFDAGERVYIRDALADATIRLKVTVPLSRRKAATAPDAKAKHPAREAREATLAFSAKRLIFPRAHRCTVRRTPQNQITLNVVHLHEVDAPDGVEPVEWILATTEPIDTLKQLVEIVDFYRARWTIEEFFKALKTGCAYERRQLESYDALLRALVLFLPIAWQLLRLRTVARDTPSAPVAEVLSPVQVDVLRAKCSFKLGRHPTARDALLAVAALGGHLKNNGEPGWITLSRGMAKLELLTEGWTAHLRSTLP